MVISIVFVVGVIVLILGVGLGDVLLRTAGISLTVIMGLTLILHVIRMRSRR